MYASPVNLLGRDLFFIAYSVRIKLAKDRVPIDSHDIIAWLKQVETNVIFCDMPHVSDMVW